MLVHGNASRHFFSHTFDIFRVSVRPVGTLGENDEMSLSGIPARFSSLTTWTVKSRAWFHARVISATMRQTLSPFVLFGKRRGADGAAHTFDSRFFNVAGSCRYTFQYVGYMLFGEHDRLEPAAERKFVFF